MPRTRYKSYHIIHIVFMVVGFSFLGFLPCLIFFGFVFDTNPEYIFVISEETFASSLSVCLSISGMTILPVMLGCFYRWGVKFGINSKGIRRMRRRRWILFPPRTSLRCKSWDQVQDITVGKDFMTAYTSWKIDVYFKESSTRNISLLRNALSIGIDNKSLPKFFEEIKKYAPEGVWRKVKISYNLYILGDESLL